MNLFSLRNGIILLMILAGTKTDATHIMGGELTYTWVSGNTYLITVTKYRDCSGIPMNNSTMVCIHSTTAALDTSINLPLTDSSEITPACAGIQSVCQGGTYNGFEKYEYNGTFTLPGNYADWIFYEELCCRNTVITNLYNAGGYGMLLMATLDNLNTPFNNSPEFGNNPVMLLNMGISYHINNGAFDADGDSLVIELTNALDGTACGNPSPVVIPYNAPFTYLNPISSSPPISVDSQTGDFTVTPLTNEADVIAFKVSEYRNGALIGTITRDIQVQVSPGANQIPVLTGVNGSNTFITTVCSGNTLSFTIQSSDPDTADSTFISASVFGQPNASLTIDATPANQTAVFSWTTDSTMISPNPYYLTVTVHDNVCPFYGQQMFTYIIYVNQCVSNDVWPGDANSDLNCDIYDILPIGMAYGSTGPVRPGASLSWVAQPAAAWTQNLPSGVNYKHADTNGDGIVNSDDTLAISLNYGLNHPNRLQQPGQIASAADLYLVSTPDTAGPSGTVTIEVRLGTTAVPVDSIYGIAFRLNFTASLVDTLLSGFAFENSWLGTPGSDLLTLSKPRIAAGYIDAAAVKNNLINVSGDSTIAKFTVVVVDNISAKSSLPSWLSDVQAITFSGTPVLLNLMGDSTIINPGPNSIGETDLLQDLIHVFPNPAKDKIVVSAKNISIDTIELTNMIGSKLLEVYPVKGTFASLDLSKFNNGIYFIKVKTERGVIINKLCLLH